MSLISGIFRRNRTDVTLWLRPFQKGFWPGAIVRAGLYARVSTHDQQTLPLQLAAVREYVSKRAWKTALEIQDVRSGASLRPQREDLLKAARRRELDGIVVWRLDRW
jgi:putative DNA-invertase from lambdoid prophage Rac